MPNLIIPCSGPGTRSSQYSKFHKALIRIGDKAVINHIIDSYKDIDKIFIILGYNKNYVKEYLLHCDYKDLEFIEIDSWNESQFTSFKQIPKYVFEKPFYYNACDNWTTHVPQVDENTIFVCNPSNDQYYDSVDSSSYSGISFVKDSLEFYEILHKTKETRNDLNIYNHFSNLQEVELSNWFDVGNSESYQKASLTNESSYNVLDKSNQEIYFYNNKVIKIFDTSVKDLCNLLESNICFPHPNLYKIYNNSFSYDFVKNTVKLENDSFRYLLNNFSNYWEFCINNNKKVLDKSIWQDKTWERYEEICKKFPEFNSVVNINGQDIDTFRTLEKIPWSNILEGTNGICHGDLVLDNILMQTDKIEYIDHRKTQVNDIFYDICKFYHSLHLNNDNFCKIEFKESNNNTYIINLELNEVDNYRINCFWNIPFISKYKTKIEILTSCIWLSMSPLNVDLKLNKFLFLYAILTLSKNV